MKSYQTLGFERQGPVGRITLNRPEAGNTITPLMQRELLDVLEPLRLDSDLQVLIIQSSGTGPFSAGFAPEAIASHQPADPAGLWPRILDVLNNLLCPTIALLQGYAWDEGLELALACDLRLAEEGARLGYPNAATRITPQGSQRLARFTGHAQALWTLLTGEVVDAQQATALGLVNRVAPAGGLEAETQRLVDVLLSRGPWAVRYVKEAVNHGLDMTLAQGLSLEADLTFYLQYTDDRPEGIRAFFERRSPRFVGR